MPNQPDPTNLYPLHELIRAPFYREQAVQYAPRQTREGELYDMDRVLIVESGGKPVMFLDQSACLLDTEYVQLCEKK